MVGAGQLARMSQQAAVDLDARLVVLARSADEPAVVAGAQHLIGDPDDPSDLRRLAQLCDVVTFDHELVPGEHLRALEADGVLVRPSSSALAVAQDKLHGRSLLAGNGFPVPDHGEAGNLDEVAAFAARHGWPVVVKTAAGGYDGRGVTVLTGPGDAAAFFAAAPAGAAQRLLIERHLELERELAVVLARREDGAVAVYPVVETTQRDGICEELVMPAPVAPRVAAEAAGLARDLAAAIGATGICAVELFLERNGRLSVNECALRPHNSGHATIEACASSQFHQHLRAVLGWPLGDPGLVVPAAAMVNLIGRAGCEDPAWRLPFVDLGPGTSVHLYHKAFRRERKLGHVTAVGESAEEALRRARAAADALQWWPAPGGGREP